MKKMTFGISFLICLLLLCSLALLKGDNLSAATVQVSDGRTPLHLAVADNDLDTARRLIEKGAEVNVADFHSKTPPQYTPGDDHG